VIVMSGRSCYPATVGWRWTGIVPVPGRRESTCGTPLGGRLGSRGRKKGATEVFSLTYETRDRDDFRSD